MFKPKQSLQILCKTVSLATIGKGKFAGSFFKYYLEKEIHVNPHLRFVPASSQLLASALRHSNPSTEVVRTLLANVDPTDATEYQRLELAAKQKQWHIVRLIAQHPAVNTETAFDKIKVRSRDSNGKDQQLLKNLESIFNA